MENQSKLFSLGSNDFIKSVSTAIFVSILAVVYGVASQAGFDVFSADWGEIGRMVINTGIVTFIARLAERFVTDKNGAVFGTIGGSK